MKSKIRSKSNYLQSPFLYQASINTVKIAAWSASQNVFNLSKKHEIQGILSINN